MRALFPPLRRNDLDLGKICPVAGGVSCQQRRGEDARVSPNEEIRQEAQARAAETAIVTKRCSCPERRRNGKRLDDDAQTVERCVASFLRLEPQRKLGLYDRIDRRGAALPLRKGERHA